EVSRPPMDATPEPDIKTTVSAEVLESLNRQLLSVREGFTVHPKLVRQMDRRRTPLAEREIDWAQAEELAFATLITGGIPVRLTGLLPHGYEGGGPEHSSARLERFLQLAAEGNIRVFYPSTPANYFHALRRQALHSRPRPLVIMTPKSLLRLRASWSRLEDLTVHSFRRLIDDPLMESYREDVRRIILCTGKVYYDLIASPLRAE